MGGKSSSTTTQSSTTAPWQPAQGLLTGILGQANNYLGQTGLNPTQTNALNTIENNANAAGGYTPQIQGITSNLLSGGGAMGQAGNIGNYYDQYRNNTNPLASNTDYNPYNTPGFRQAIDTATSDITNSVNGQFAAAGRDGSPANTMALGRGIMQGIAPIIQSQYNANVANQQGAANNLYQAGNTTSGLLSGLNQQSLGNQAAGVGMIGQGIDASNYGANTVLQAEASRLGIPVGQLSQLAQLGIPIAGLGSQSSGTSNTENQMSGVQQFMGITSGLANLFGGGGSNGGSTASGIAKFISDRRAKKDIERVGTLPNGLGVYTFKYIWDDPKTYIGVMAQEVLDVMPAAVSKIGDYFAVDYGMVLEGA